MTLQQSASLFQDDAQSPSCEVECKARLGWESSCHLYRGAHSPQSMGVVVEMQHDLPVGTVVKVEMEFPWGEVISAKTALHWSTQMNAQTVRVGLRWLNPSPSLGIAVARAATLFPTRLFDEPRAEPPAPPDGTDVSDCPSTVRSSYPTAVALSQRHTTSVAPVRFLCLGELLARLRLA